MSRIRSNPLLPVLSLILCSSLLGGCAVAVVGGVTAGAHAAHDRRSVGTVVDDRRIQLAAFDAFNKDKELALQNRVVIVVYNGVMLLAGEVRTPELKARAEQRVSGYDVRRVVNEIEVREPEGFWARRRDNTTTARVKTALLDITSMEGFDPTRVNVTTTHRVVYLMGKVNQEESDAITEIARNVGGVERVVKLFDYSD